MLNKFLAALAAVFTLMLGTPVASAADIPILTWEKGKEHNIVLGGNSQVKNWKIQLTSTTGEALDFKQSKLDPKGYVVFSVQIPDTYESGVYTVVTTGVGVPEKIVAGVKIVAGSSDPSSSPVGSRFPQTCWFCEYSVRPLPVR